MARPIGQGKCTGCDKRRVLYVVRTYAGKRLWRGEEYYCKECFRQIVGREPREDERWPV